MIYSIECPYCGEQVDLDGLWQDEEPNQDFEVECEHCNKIIMVEFEFPHFTAKKADCKNGGEHNWTEVSSSYFGKYQECFCGATKDKISKEEANKRFNDWVIQRDKEIK